MEHKVRCQVRKLEDRILRFEPNIEEGGSRIYSRTFTEERGEEDGRLQPTVTRRQLTCRSEQQERDIDRVQSVGSSLETLGSNPRRLLPGPNIDQEENSRAHGLIEENRNAQRRTIATGGQEVNQQNMADYGLQQQDGTWLQIQDRNGGQTRMGAGVQCQQSDGYHAAINWENRTGPDVGGARNRGEKGKAAGSGGRRRGVALLIHKSIPVLETGGDAEGRVVWGRIDSEVAEEIIAVASVYAPNAPEDRIIFWRQIKELLPSGRWWIGGIGTLLLAPLTLLRAHQCKGRRKL
ncbi:hypothetical protein R1sor_009800 [Riccia sorocarpa]|uniref:Uncharacterized protein n=1 Tax=Riccia sorocarpa TaxID=122646 RepID=A0ABD3HY52_9MARC